MKRFVPSRVFVRRICLSHGDLSMMPVYGPIDTTRSELQSGVKVVAARTNESLLAACTIMFQAGSRFESSDDIGANHFLRVASAASGCAYTSYSKARVLPQYGAAITCTGDRQNIAYTLKCPVNVFSDMKHYLLDTATRCCYNNWDIDELKEVVWNSYPRIHPAQRVLDLVQKACWGGPLTNSIFCVPDRVNSMTGDILDCFVRKNCNTRNCTVASVGVPFEETLKLAEMIQNRPGSCDTQPPTNCFPRRGYEVEDLGPNSITWIAVAVPSCGFFDLRCLLLHSIVAAACGTGNSQMGGHREDRTLSSPLGIMAGEDVHTDYKAFNISYKEVGTFGILARTRACSARDVTLAASEFLTTVGGLSFNQIEIGKERLKLGVALNDEDCVNMTQGLAMQLVCNHQIESTCDAMCLIDAIRPDEVVCVAQNLSKYSNDMALAVVGDVGCVPHDRQLIRSV